MLMKGENMPVETSAGVIAILGKFLSWLASSLGLTITGFGIGGALASIVVMCMTEPRSRKEWAVSLISTLVCSFGLGAYVIVHYQLLSHVVTLLDVFAIIGVVFACGLPGWSVVRAFFVWSEKNKARDIVELVQDVKKVV